MKTVGYIILGVIVLFIAFLVIGNMAYDANPEKFRAQAAIDMCYKPVNDELLDRGTRLFARNACQKMQREYKDKYGYWYGPSAY